MEWPTSDFNGRVFLRSDYTTNQVYDDVSSQFSGIATNFDLKVNGATSVGMGTIGGNIANGSPIGDIAPLFLALGAKMQIKGKESARKINVENFYVGKV